MAAVFSTASIRPAPFATVASIGTQAAELSTAHRLTTSIAVLATVASAGGLLLPQLYRDNTFVTSAWKSTDYAFYLFGAAFNPLFLVYAGLVALSILALVFGLATADLTRLGRRFRTATPARWIGGYMLFVAAGTSAVYVFQSLNFIVTGRLPPIVAATGHPTSVVFALDLSLMVPGLVLGARWLWNRQPWGYILGTVLNVKGAVYTFALAVASMWAASAGVAGVLDQVPLWLLLSVGCLTSSGLLLANISGSEIEGMSRRTSC